MSSTSQSATTINIGNRFLVLFLFYGMVVILSILIFVSNLPYVYSRGLASLSTERAALLAVGLSPEVITVFELVLRVIFFSVFGGVSLLLFWKRAKDPIAYLVSVMLMGTGYLYSADVPHAYSLWIAAVFLNALAETAQVLFFFSFPNGRYIPAWSRHIAIPLLLFRFVIWANIFLTNGSQGAIEVGATALLGIIGIGTQIYRYRVLATPTQRQQVKALLIGIVITVLLVVPSIYLLSVTDTLTPSRHLGLYLLVKTARDLALISVPLMMGLA